MTDKRISTYAKGVMGEDAALCHMLEGGMELLERRYRSPFGEIDLIMRDGDTLAFVEVKARERADEESAMLAVDARKRERLILTARRYLGEHPTDGFARFDVALVTRAGVRLIKNAFEGGEW